MILHFLFSIFRKSLINRKRFFRFRIVTSSLLLNVLNNFPGKISFSIKIVSKCEKVYRLDALLIEKKYKKLLFSQRYLELFNGLALFPIVLSKYIRQNIFHNAPLSKVGI